MPSRNELNARARVVGLDPATYANDSKLEQKILYLEKNATAIAGTLATGTLTASGAATNGDEVEIDGVTYTFVTALSETKATQTITTTGTFSDGEIISVDGVTYVMKTTLSDPEVANEVLIGASAAASLDNIKSAINGTGTSGTDYSSITVAHPRVTATTNANDSQVVQYDEFGTKGNEAQVYTDAANASWGASSLAGGVAPVAHEVLLTGVAATELDNLKQAINAGDTENGLDDEGTNWSTGTRAHPTVTATTNGASTQVVQARDYVYGDTISTTDPTDDGSVLSWGATTLATVAADVNAEAAATTRGTNAGIAGDANV